MKHRFEPRLLAGVTLALALAAGCTGTPASQSTAEQKVSGTASGALPSRTPATRAPTPTPTATPRPVASTASAVPTAPPAIISGGRLEAAFETRGLVTSQAREVVCYPTQQGDAVIVARFVLADAADGPSKPLPTRFAFELDAGQLQPDTSYTLAYRPAGGGSALETTTFQIPERSHKPMPEPSAGYTSQKLTLNEAGLTVEGEFKAATTWRHALVYNKDKRLVVTAHAQLTGTTDKFVIAPVPGVDGGEEATVYLHGDGKVVLKKTLVREKPVGQ